MPADSSTGGGWSPTADRSPALAGRPASEVDLTSPECVLRLHEQLLLELRLLGRELTPTRDARGDLVVASGEVLQPVDRLSRLAGRRLVKTKLLRLQAGKADHPLEDVVLAVPSELLDHRGDTRGVRLAEPLVGQLLTGHQEPSLDPRHVG